MLAFLWSAPGSRVTSFTLRLLRHLLRVISLRAGASSDPVKSRASACSSSRTSSHHFLPQSFVADISGCEDLSCEEARFFQRNFCLRSFARATTELITLRARITRWRRLQRASPSETKDVGLQAQAEKRADKSVQSPSCAALESVFFSDAQPQSSTRRPRALDWLAGKMIPC